MSGPWDNYQPTATASSGPWAKYGAPPPSAASPIPPPAFNPSRTPAAATMHPSFLIGNPNSDATPMPAPEVAKSMIRSVADVSAPAIAHRIGQKMGVAPQGDIYPGEGQLKDVPGKATLMMAGEMGEPDMVPEAGAARVAQPAPIPKPSGEPGTLGRIGEVALRRAGRIPGVQAVKDADYILRGPKNAPEAAPAPKAPIPETDGIPWGSGGRGPLELRGQRIPVEPATETSTPEAGHAGQMVESIAKPAPVTPSRIGDLLNDSLGGKPLRPNVPLREQIPGVTAPKPQKFAPVTNLSEELKAEHPVPESKFAPVTDLAQRLKLPEDFTPVKGSSVIQGYKYDPATKEFSAATSGGTYIHGDVSPEQAAAFENASSKGKAWSELKNNSTYVGKVVNGNRVSAKPPTALHSATPEDLTPAWQESLDHVKTQKAARIAKPR